MGLQLLFLVFMKYTLALIYGTFALIRLAVMIVLSPRKSLAKVERPLPPSVLNDPSHGEHRYVTLKDRGIKLHYVSNGPSDAPLMLFVHGFPEFWFSWRHQMREFAKDYHVVAIDQRGYGDSDKPARRSSYEVMEMVSDLKSLIPALGYSSATVVAHDWGSPIVWTLATVYPDLVDKMVQMNGPHPTTFAKKIKSSLRQFFLSWYIFFFQCPLLPELMISLHDFAALKKMFTEGCQPPNALSAEEIDAYVYTFQKNGFTGPINYYRAAPMNPPKKQEPKLIDIPTLIIWGTADLALDTSLATDAAKLHRNCTVKLIEGATHWVQQDEPDKVNDLMRKFLRGGELTHL